MAQRGGVIVFLTDVAALQAWPSFAPHSIAKAGLVHLTEVLAKAWAPGMRVCGDRPGHRPAGARQRRRLARARGERGGARARGLAGDIAGAVRYLVEADYVTGIQLVVDGGRLL